jgi:hypothetical protein
MGVHVRTIEKRPARRGAKQFFPIGALVVTHTRTEVGATSYAPSPNALGRSLGRDFPFHSVSAVLTVMSSFTGIAQVVSTPSQRTTSAFPAPRIPTSPATYQTRKLRRSRKHAGWRCVVRAECAETAIVRSCSGLALALQFTFELA